MKSLTCLLPLLLIAYFCAAQDKDRAETTDINKLIESRRFEFIAQTANPLRGRTINLTSEYTFAISPDTVISHLPYYGRAYQANLDPDDAGINFTSTDFTFQEKGRKKGGWQITVKPKDVRNAPNANLSVSPNGYASLHIISSDRQAISFRGMIRKPLSGK